MKSRTLLTVAACVFSLAEIAAAQIMPAGRVGLTGRVQPASCTTCDGGTHGFYDGMVGGAPCMDCKVRPRLFPPCPQPCQTTLLAEVVYDIKHVVDTGLSSLFCCVLGDTGFGCGCHGVCTCDEMHYASIEHGQEYIIESGEIPPSVMQPVPETNGAEPDPFRDDPPSMQPIPNNSTTQTRRPAVSKSVVRTSSPPKQIRRASHAQPVVESIPTPPRSLQLTSLEAAPLTGAAESAATPAVAWETPDKPLPAAGHYHPRRATSLRRVDGAQLRKAPVQVQAGTRTLRFREVE